VDRVSPQGEWESGYVKTLQNPLGVAFDSKGTLYVLQFASLFSPARLKYLPYGGKLLRVNPDRSLTPVVTDLTYPTFMKFDKNDVLWIVNYGNQSSHGEGQILKIHLGSGLAKGPRIVPPADAPTEEVLKAEAKAREDLAKMNQAAAQKKGTVIKIVEGPDTLKWGYDPAIAHVHPGEVVTILNVGKMPHSATSTKGTFDTGLIPAGETREIQVTEAGEYDFLCIPHPWMKGKMVVSGEAYHGKLAQSVAINDAPSAADSQGGLVNFKSLLGLFFTLIAMTVGVAVLLRKKPPGQP
jgi:plastocyanin